MKWICPKCGLTLEGNLVLPIRCCEIEPVSAMACRHRGDIAGIASCGCGVMYHCNKLGVVCSDRRPAEPLFTITLNMPLGSMQLDENVYRCCSDCPHFPTE